MQYDSKKLISEKPKNMYIYISIASILFTIFFWNWCYISKSTFAEKLNSSNVETYIVGLIIYVTLLLLGSFVYYLKSEDSLKKKKNNTLTRNKQLIICVAMTLVGTLLYVEWELKSQFVEVGVENGAYTFFPLGLRATVTIALLLCMGASVAKRYDLEKPVLWLSYFLSLLISFMGVYVSNPFSQWGGGQINISSIVTTIYNVADMTPFTWSTTPLYGHYGLFFFFPLKLLGTSASDVAVCLGLAALIEQAAFLYVINSFNTPKWVKVLIALAAIVRPTYRYPAITPIRTLWPLLICAWLVYVHKRRKKESRILWITSYILGGLAILWNIETGVGCMLGIFAYYLWISVFEIRTKEKRLRIITLNTLKNLIMIIAASLVPIVIVNVYNFICGERTLIFKSFFYPYIGSDWTTNALSCDVPLGNHAWVYIMILLLACLAAALINILFLNSDDRFAPIMAISTIGIVVFTYYFNEAHWGCMDIVRKICAILTVFIVSEFYDKLETKCDDLLAQFKRVILILSFVVWGSMVVSVVMSDPIRISEMYRMGVYDNDAILTDANNNLLGNVPENVYGVGQGINAIYHELGWNNHSHYKDTSAIVIGDVDGGYTALINDILSQDEFLIGNTESYDLNLQNDIFAIDSTYNLIGLYEVCAYEYAYYSRK